jgi:hypothetical protein
MGSGGAISAHNDSRSAQVWERLARGSDTVGGK